MGRIMTTLGEKQLEEYKTLIKTPTKKNRKLAYSLLKETFNVLLNDLRQVCEVSEITFPTRIDNQWIQLSNLFNNTSSYFERVCHWNRFFVDTQNPIGFQKFPEREIAPSVWELEGGERKVVSFIRFINKVADLDKTDLWSQMCLRQKCFEKERQKQIHIIYPYVYAGGGKWSYGRTHPIGMYLHPADTNIWPPLAGIIDRLLESQGMNRYRLKSEFLIKSKKKISGTTRWYSRGEIFKLSFSSELFDGYQVKIHLTNQEGKYAAYHTLEGPKEVLERPKGMSLYSDFLSFGIKKTNLLAFFPDIPDNIYVKAEPAQEGDGGVFFIRRK